MHLSPAVKGDEMHKACRDCGLVHPITDYPKYSGNRGYRPMCRKCFNQKDAKTKRDKRLNDPQHYLKELERNRKYRNKYSDGYRKHQLNKREKQKSNYFNDLKHRCKQIVKSVEARAFRKGFDCELTPEILITMLRIQDFKCAVTGIELEISASQKYSRSPIAPSVDRKNSDRGYTLDNIQIVCAWYNLMKNEWSDDDAKKFVYIAYHSMFGGVN